ncbi:MAG TPA: undecaprenyldiphospho-muramoylpentapeptide beta-N-acetylglucosaminyltransferase [bacterium]|nr:undecaprenyldiphospho-muramoylpentapeptide beta-N-acetylglucosaminyltransferase [bacterium]HPL95531.1 undecaprenyldiphospho-muramoylpentapeptide beta-N-acetylglucosaminyltransferase [bacterium]
MKILYSGGGTLGSVSPLIATHQKLVSKRQSAKVPSDEALWLGTRFGPERQVVESEGINFKSIVGGKFRRYFSFKNLFDFFKIKVGFWQAFFIIKKFKPDLILTAGSFVAVPVAWAGWFLRVPIFVHQQDVRVGLANKLMAPFAKKITVALEKSLDDFKKEKAVLVGNPVREKLRNKEIEKLREKMFVHFNNNLPIVLVLGGGTGALFLNELVWQSLEKLTKFCNIIHLTGKNKCQSLPAGKAGIQRQNARENYQQFTFLNADQLAVVYSKATLVISRAGMSTLTELAYFKKPTIIIPIPDSHQEENAKYFAEKKSALYLSQKELTSEKLVAQIKNLLVDEQSQKELGEQINKIFVDYTGEKYLTAILN